MGGAKKLEAKDLIKGGVLQCAEAATFGMPFEVWKTYMGAHRNESTMQAFRSVYSSGGVRAFWRGLEAKLVESALKGAVLLFSKEGIIRATRGLGFGDVASGLIGGFGGGVCQVTVMGPCTFLITASVASQGTKGQMSMMERMGHTFKTQGVGGFYKGGTALMLRQGSNWASRQGITDAVRAQIRKVKGKDKLSIGDEALSGVIGGCLSTWNQPFEVLRIDAQAAGARGEPSKNILETSSKILKESGVGGFFRGVIPRMGLCVAQTLFMVTIPHILVSKGL